MAIAAEHGIHFATYDFFAELMATPANFRAVRNPPTISHTWHRLALGKKSFV